MGAIAYGEEVRVRRLVKGGLVVVDPRELPVRADILVENGRITQVGGKITVGPDVDVVDATACLVIPGLVNTHTHAHNSIAKGAIDGVPLMVWLQYLRARLPNLDSRDIYVGAAVAAIEMAKTGTTCACDMAQVVPWPTDETIDAVVQAYLDVGLRVSCAAQVFDLTFLDSVPGLAREVPEDLRQSLTRSRPYPTAEVLDTIERAAHRWNRNVGGKVRFGVGVSIVTLCSDEFLRALGQVAQDRDLLVQTHLVGTRVEAYAAYERYGMSATAKLAQLGLLGESTLVVHAVWLTDDDIALIAETGTSVSHNPISNLKLGSGVAPIPEMLERGCNVALGTDGSASSDNQNMFGPLRQVAIQHRINSHDYDKWITAADAFEMATVNGAVAAGFGGEVGAIREGYAADLTLLDLRSPYFHPVNNLLNQLVHCEVGSSVQTVMVNGEVIVKEGTLTTVNEPSLLEEFDEIARRAAADLADENALPRRLEPHLRALHAAAAGLPWPVSS